MINTRFEAYKISREIKRSGMEFKFMRSQLDEYGEPSGEPAEVASLTGLYHESSSFVTESASDYATTRSKKQPMLLCLADEVNDSDIKFGDMITIPSRGPQRTSKTLKYVGCVDIQNWGLIVDMSFEEVDEGDDSQV